jgi:hypothetical protein
MRHFRTASLTLAFALTATVVQAQTTIITQPAPPAAVITAPPAVVTTDPLVLTPVQRRVIYRRIVQQPPVVERQVTFGAAPAPVVEYRVGASVPAATTLYPVPQEVVTEVPAIGNYRYTVVNNRAWLVDPMTHEIVAEVAE